VESLSQRPFTEESLEQDVTKVLKDLIRLRRKRMSQAEVARKMGVSRQQVYNIESGRQGDPSARTLERYARAIGAKLLVVAS
jgi:transcriptional regulator with XRE-family HTH domain